RSRRGDAAEALPGAHAGARAGPHPGALRGAPARDRRHRAGRGAPAAGARRARGPRMRTAMLVGLLALTLACGPKAPPVPPQLVRPEPVSELGAMATPDGVRLTWGRPDHYTSGKSMKDLGGFTIERAAGDGGQFVRVGTVEVTDRTRFRKEHRF